ncbi:hypothetical protein MHYP_G00115980 [Metynnis hypsauchen]
MSSLPPLPSGQEVQVRQASSVPNTQLDRAGARQRQREVSESRRAVPQVDRLKRAEDKKQSRREQLIPESLRRQRKLCRRLKA